MNLLEMGSGKVQKAQAEKRRPQAEKPLIVTNETLIKAGEETKTARS
jgi:hypothetical protein